MASEGPREPVGEVRTAPEWGSGVGTEAGGGQRGASGRSRLSGGGRGRPGMRPRAGSPRSYPGVPQTLAEALVSARPAGPDR